MHRVRGRFLFILWTLIYELTERRPFVAEETIELVVVIFAAEDEANRALEALQGLEKQQEIRLFDAAILKKHRDGKFDLMEMHDIDAGHGALVGAIAGGLIGLLGGPVGVLIGAAAGAATGGVTAGKIDLGFSKSFISELQAAVEPGKTALVLIVAPEWSDKVIALLEQQPGKLFRHLMHGKIAEQLAARDDS